MRSYSFHNNMQTSQKPKAGLGGGVPIGRLASRAFIAMLLLVGFVLIAQGLWIKGKAALDDSLLNRAVERSLDQGTMIRPSFNLRTPDLG